MEIPNRAILGGHKLLLLKDDATGRHALARMLGQDVILESGWVDHAAAAEVAYRVLGGDAKTIANPRTLRGLAVHLLAFECAVYEGAVGKEGAVRTLTPTQMMEGENVRKQS